MLGGAISVLGLLMLIVYLIVYYVIAFQSEFPTEAKVRGQLTMKAANRQGTKQKDVLTSPPPPD